MSKVFGKESSSTRKGVVDSSLSHINGLESRILTKSKIENCEREDEGHSVLTKVKMVSHSNLIKVNDKK